MNIEHTKENITVTFASPRRMLSSASVGRGGFLRTDTIVNIHTSAGEIQNHTPETLVSDFLRSKKLNLGAVGLLTSAHFEYAQFIYLQEKDIKVLAVVTAGVSNALNISESSSTGFTGETIPRAGTINIITITNAYLLDECMVSSVITSTEAKTAALVDLQVKSVISGNQATGTGTDSVAIVSGNQKNIQYAGGHTLYGQLLGRAVYTGVKSSLERKTYKGIKLDKICGEFQI